MDTDEQKRQARRDLIAAADRARQTISRFPAKHNEHYWYRPWVALLTTLFPTDQGYSVCPQAPLTSEQDKRRLTPDFCVLQTTQFRDGKEKDVFFLIVEAKRPLFPKASALKCLNTYMNRAVGLKTWSPIIVGIISIAGEWRAYSFNEADYKARMLSPWVPDMTSEESVTHLLVIKEKVNGWLARYRDGDKDNSDDESDEYNDEEDEEDIQEGSGNGEGDDHDGSRYSQEDASGDDDNDDGVVPALANISLEGDEEDEKDEDELILPPRRRPLVKQRPVASRRVDSPNSDNNDFEDLSKYAIRSVKC